MSQYAIDEAISLLNKCEGTFRQHGFFRGTFDASIAEAQGLRFTRAQGGSVDHLGSAENSKRAAENCLRRIRKYLNSLSNLDTEIQDHLRAFLRPVRARLRYHIACTQRLRQLCDQIHALHPQRLANIVPVAGPRNIEHLVTVQLDVLGSDIIPPGFSGHIEDFYTRIDSMPLDQTESLRAVRRLKRMLQDVRSQPTASLRRSALRESRAMLRLDDAIRRLGPTAQAASRRVARAARRISRASLRGARRAAPILGPGIGAWDAMEAWENNRPFRAVGHAIGIFVDPVDLAMTAYDLVEPISEELNDAYYDALGEVWPEYPNRSGYNQMTSSERQSLSRWGSSRSP